jgi:hypothetical protein
MATALTAGRRCSRRRLGLGGGAASVSMFTVAPRSGPAPPRSRTAPPTSGSSRPRHSAAATRRRRRGTPAFTAPRPLLLPPSLPLPLRRRGSGRGQNPNVGWWRWTTAPCPPPLAVEPPAPQGMAKTQRCPCWVCPGVRGGAARSLSTPPRSQGRSAGVNGTFPPPARLDSRARAPGPSACAPAGRPGRAPPRERVWRDRWRASATR